MKFVMSNALALAAMTLFGAAAVAHAQSGKLGAYAGTFEVSGTQFGPEVTYRATVKVSLPVSRRDASSVTAEFLAGEAPAGTMLLAQWDISHKEKFADSGGQFNSYTCSLAAPVEVPVMPTGVLDVDLQAKKHTLSLTVLTTKDVAFNCRHSRSGAYKKKQGIALTLGTGSPGMQGANPQPFSDAANLTAKYTLVPGAEAKGQYGPIVQAWTLKLVR